MNNILKLFNKSLGIYNVKGIEIEPRYWMVVVIILLIFMLLFTMARLRYLYVHWNLGRSAYSMFFWGFVMAIVVEGFLILSGRTLLTTIIGWNNAPKPISTALDIGRGKLINVLGVQDEKREADATQIILDYQKLAPYDAQSVRTFICQP